MKTKQLKWKQLLAGVGIFLLCSMLEVHAQVRTGGGGFGGGGRGGNTASTYNNNGAVGSATFSVDPDTHSIIFTADAKTAEQIKEVIASLDRPKPQVLIKVVFMEVQHNNSSDIGVEGGWTGGAGDNRLVSAANVFSFIHKVIHRSEGVPAAYFFSLHTLRKHTDSSVQQRLKTAACKC